MTHQLNLIIINFFLKDAMRPDERYNIFLTAQSNHTVLQDVIVTYRYNNAVYSTHIFESQIADL